MISYSEKYLKKFKLLLEGIKTSDIETISKTLIDCKKKKNSVFIFGNGGSASIASHVSTDLNKVCNIKSRNFNEANHITCFSNDYGYEKWVQKALAFHADKGDLLISISSSGESKNIINGSKFAKKIGCKVITLTGFDKNNKLKKIGHINLWLESKNYNFIEMVHHTWLLSIVDLIAKAKF